jgi:putative sterol carrier protein
LGLEHLTEEIERRARSSPRLGYAVKFALEEGGVVRWDGTGVAPIIDNSDIETNTTIRISQENLAKLLSGALDPTIAYMTGKLKVEGSLGVALKLTAMLGD